MGDNTRMEAERIGPDDDFISAALSDALLAGRLLQAQPAGYSLSRGRIERWPLPTGI